MLKRTEIDGIIKDERSGALINIDKQALNGYKLQKNKFREIDSIKKDLSMLKEEVKKIESILKMLLEKVE